METTTTEDEDFQKKVESHEIMPEAVIESMVDSGFPTKPPESNKHSPESDTSELDTNSHQKAGRKRFHEICSNKQNVKRMKRKLVFRVTKPSGKPVDGNDMKMIYLENLVISKFGQFIPEHRKHRENKQRYSRWGFIISYKDLSKGDLFLPVQGRRTKDSEQDKQNQEKLIVIQHCLKDKIEEFCKKMKPNV